MVYHLVLKSGFVVGLSTEQIEGSTGAVFAKEYLDRLGIHVPNETETYVAVYHPFINFKYVEADAIIVAEENTQEVAAVTKNIKRGATQRTIVSGFSLVVAGADRQYDCSIEDQLAVIQALHLFEQGAETVDLKCYHEGTKGFVSHTKEECKKVMTTMSEHILLQRKALAK